MSGRKKSQGLGGFCSVFDFVFQAFFRSGLGSARMELNLYFPPRGWRVSRREA